MTERPALVVGLMSGTSLDGIDAALVRFRGPTQVSLLGCLTRSFSDTERRRIQELIDQGPARDYALLGVEFAGWAADAVEAVLDQAHVRASDLDAIGFPGQTIWHEPPRVTWQLGEPAVLAERFGVRVVSNFRARDVAAGGQGAPLVPMADVLLFGAPDHARVLLNLGGMANLTYVPRREDEDGAFAFDTGPGVAIIDALARLENPELPFDVDGRLTAAGAANQGVLAELLADPFFGAAPPKSTGRERFGAAYARRLRARLPGPDGVATAAALTARSIAQAFARWVPEPAELVVSGGGCHHPALMRMLAEELAAALPHGKAPSIRRFDDLFFNGDAKEAVAFALLAYLTIHGQPGNLPAATGAAGPRVLGSVTPP